MSKFRIWMAVFAAAAIGLLGCVVPSSASAHGKTDNREWYYTLTERDFGNYCLGQGHQRGVTVVHPSDAYALRCQDADESLSNVNVTDVCNYTYGADARKKYGDWINGEPINLMNRLEDMGNPYSWGCFVTFQDHPLGEPDQADLQDWCANQGLDLYYDNRSYKAYGWFCTDNNGQFTGIPMDQLCAWRFGRHSIDRVANVYDKNAWECWYVRNPKHHHHHQWK